MAIASTRTLLSLDRFAQLIGSHPLHFNQVTVSSIADANFCGVPVLQYSWQDADRTGREEIAEMIASVETELMEYLGFSLKPDYFAGVPRGYPQPSNPELFGTSLYDVRSLIRASWIGQGYAISGGQEAKTLIANRSVVYTDVDGDGYFETATITVTGYATDTVAGEIAIYYPGNNGDDTFEIRPTSVVLNSGVATIICRREQLVLPALMFGLSVTAVDGTDNTQFVADVDVYRHWLDPSAQQVEFRWENVPWDSTSMAATFSVQTGAMMVTDQMLGWASLQPATWDAPSGSYTYDCFNIGRMPDTVRLWFKAGYPLDRNGNMAPIWERCVTYLALSRLDRPLCQCSSLETFTRYWATDLAISTSEQTRQVSRRFLDCPLGTTRAAKYVWDAIQRYKLPDSNGVM